MIVCSGWRRYKGRRGADCGNEEAQCYEEDARFEHFLSIVAYELLVCVANEKKISSF